MNIGSKKLQREVGSTSAEHRRDSMLFISQVVVAQTAIDQEPMKADLRNSTKIHLKEVALKDFFVVPVGRLLLEPCGFRPGHPGNNA
jgi:hypothetical protein